MEASKAAKRGITVVLILFVGFIVTMVWLFGPPPAERPPIPVKKKVPKYGEKDRTCESRTG